MATIKNQDVSIHGHQVVLSAYVPDDKPEDRIISLAFADGDDSYLVYLSQYEASQLACKLNQAAYS